MSVPVSDGSISLSSNNISGVTNDTSRGDSIQAAIARTFTRGLALYFARPVRLFRPSKVNGWQTLRNQAQQEGTSIGAGYILSLIKLQGVFVIPKHFVPPMLVNALLGTVLWQTYATVSELTEPTLGKDTLLKSAVCGATAGACQAVVAAPAENVRLLLQRGFTGSSWSCAWKEVFLTSPVVKEHKTLHEIRELRSWLREVGHMAGRGWNGWGWGCGKDSCGFAAFFLMFELSRRAGSSSRSYVQTWAHDPSHSQYVSKLKRLPAITNGVVLVTGGVVAGVTYEIACRPWDVARHLIHESAFNVDSAKLKPLEVIRRHLITNGVSSFFRTSEVHPAEVVPKWTTFLRTLGRVGPWGIGFLVWEASGHGLQ